MGQTERLLYVLVQSHLCFLQFHQWFSHVQKSQNRTIEHAINDIPLVDYHASLEQNLPNVPS